MWYRSPPLFYETEHMTMSRLAWDGLLMLAFACTHLYSGNDCTTLYFCKPDLQGQGTVGLLPLLIAHTSHPQATSRTVASVILTCDDANSLKAWWVRDGSVTLDRRFIQLLDV